MIDKTYVTQVCWYHLRQIGLGFVNILHAPIVSLLITLCMACALFLAIFSCVLLENFRGICATWNKSAEIALYLKKPISSQAATNLTTQLQTHGLLSQVTLFTPDDGLKYFTDSPTLQTTVTTFKENPLPYVIKLYPNVIKLSATQAQTFLKQLESYPEVDTVRTDYTWLAHSYQLLYFMRNIMILLVLILGINALLVLGGGSYLGARYFIHKSVLTVQSACAHQFAWYGFFGGLLAIYVLRCLVLFLQHAGILISSLAISGEVFILISGMVLNYISAWLSQGFR